MLVAARGDLVACAAIALGLLVLKFTTLHPVGPFLFFDELLYREGAEALAVFGNYPSGQYPFLYPLLMAPAYATGTGYEGMFAINVVASTLLVPACWLLARAIGLRPAWPAALLAAAMPLHFLYPTQILSENLFVPLFVLATWYTIRAKPAGPVAAFAFGLLLASLFLVKYLALPAVPLLWAFWLMGRVAGRVQADDRTIRSGAAWSAAAILLATGAWLAYARTHGIATAEAFGANVSGLNAGDLITPAAVVTWATAYLACLVLVAGAFLPRLAESLVAYLHAPVRDFREHPQARLVLLTLLLAGGYWLVCVQHSAGGVGNYPVPQRVVVRYMMHLAPLFMTLGLAFTLRPFRPVTWPWVATATAAGVALLWISHGILYGDMVWDFPDWFATIPLYSTDILAYQDTETLRTLLIVAAASAIAYLHRTLAIAWVASVLLLVAFATMSVHERNTRHVGERPLHPRVLAPFVARALEAGREVVVVSEVRGVKPDFLRQGLVFWGLERRSFGVARDAAEATRSTPGALVLSVGSDVDGRDVLFTYRANGGTYHVLLGMPRSVPAAPPDTAGRFAGSITLSPASICSNARGMVVTVAWRVADAGAQPVSVNIRDARGREKPFSKGPASGQRDTGPWVRPGMHFVLRAADGSLVDEVAMDSRRCPPASAD